MSTTVFADEFNDKEDSLKIDYNDKADYFRDNNIFYYDPSGKLCAPAGGISSIEYSTSLDMPELAGNDNAEKIWNFLKQEGFSDEQAAGFMGNIRQESNYKPDLTESNGVGYGIIQWSGGRRTELEKKASDLGVPRSDLGFQLAYLKDEALRLAMAGLGGDWRNLYSRFNVTADDNTWDQMKNRTSIEDATAFFHDAFERSGDYGAVGNINHRIKYAEEDYERFTGKQYTAGLSDKCLPFGGGNLIQTLLAYAWPEYHEPTYLAMMPAYAEAVKKAQSDGRGVGGIRHPGIDCAGFVSLLIVDSGFDPEYNTKGTYATPGSTGEAIQRSWMEENWTSLGKGGSINVADLRPGDVAVTRAGSGEHIFIHVGQVDGFGNIFASASLDNRAPMAAGSYENAVDDSYDWFGKR